ncbi:hypothetical protein LXL04_007036 [Taraxacum kok-saghyz]
MFEDQNILYRMSDNDTEGIDYMVDEVGILDFPMVDDEVAVELYLLMIMIWCKRRQRHLRHSMGRTEYNERKLFTNVHFNNGQFVSIKILLKLKKLFWTSLFPNHLY